MDTCSTDLAPVWEVRLPDRRVPSLGYATPQATVLIQSTEGGEERLRVPKAVGRLLASKQKADEIHPQSRDELAHVIDTLELQCANTRIERLINRRDYSQLEIAQKLEQDGYQPKTIACCLERARTIGLVSDRRYADVFIRSKVASGWGIRRIVAELSRKGIEVEELPGWPYEYLDPEDELARAIEIAETRQVDGPRAYQKLVRFLCTRGFSLGVATRAASHILA